MAASGTSAAPPSPVQVQTRQRPDVLVAGGGLIGLCCAEALAARGLRVEVWERDAKPAGRATAASAGMLAPLAEVPDDRAFLEVCLEARDLWQDFAPRLASQTGVALDYDRSGALIAEHPALPLADLRAAAKAAGEPCRELSAEEALGMVPDLSAEHRSFLHLPGEHRVSSRRTATALLARLADQGALVRTGRALERLEIGDGCVIARADGHRLEAAHVVLATGAWSAGIAGVPAPPVHPVKGQMLRFSGVRWPLTGCLRAGHHYAVRRRGGGLLVGATVEPEAGFDATVTGAGVADLLAFAGWAFPDVLQRPLVDQWSGLRPGSPDARPLLGPISERVWAATGHYRNGVLLAPWSARFLADWIERGRSPEDRTASLFDPLRPAPGRNPDRTAPLEATGVSC